MIFTDDLPKTRSGKIMRRLLRDVAEGRALGDTTTLADPGVVEEIKRRAADVAAPRTERRSDSRDTGAGATGRVEPGRAVVFDIDGVLSDAAGRQHFLERPPAATGTRSSTPCGDDPLIDEVARLLELLDADLQIVLLTGPPAAGAAARPLGWLDRYELRWDLLIMRDDGDYARRPRVQAATPCTTCGRYGFDLRLAFEDDRRNVEMFHAEGVPCVYIHSGYYD